MAPLVVSDTMGAQHLGGPTFPKWAGEEVSALDTGLDIVEVKRALNEALRENLRCALDDGRVRVDTPYVLQDGHLLQVFLNRSPAGDITASDGGWATSQFELHTTHLPERRYDTLRNIATRLGLEWEGDFRLTAGDLTDAARRIALLARAVDLTLTLARGTRPPGTKTALDAAEARPGRWQVEEELESKLTGTGLAVTARARIPIHGPQRSVTVDYLVSRNGSEAVLDILTSRAKLDRTAVDFNVLNSSGYPGSLFAVYNEASAAGRQPMLERFKVTAPERTILVPARDAAAAIKGRLFPGQGYTVA